MAKLTPYLMFNGNCSEAMNFYKEVLGGELWIQKVSESPMANPEAEGQDNVMHSSLTGENMTLFASDMSDEETTTGTKVELCISTATREELESIFDKMSDGAEITSPLKTEFFGTFGALTDKFGIRWMFQTDMK